jgi:predicted DsbA family dithiol-disulfide isomerase
LEKFKKCVNDGVFTKKVHDDYDNALATGATASPFIVLVVQGEKPRTITGAIPYSALKKIVDDAIIKSGS